MKGLKRIIVTGGAGFIGSNFVKKLNSLKYNNITIVDHLSGIQGKRKKKNLTGLDYREYFEGGDFLKLVKSDDNSIKNIDVIVHLGARTDTTERDKEFLLQNNTNYSKELFGFCIRNNCRLIYASSAATYGDGSKGYSPLQRNLSPLNYYGYSKYLFDEWVLNSHQKPKQWVGLKFFNVYGPNEYHKDFMASVVYHGFNEIKNNNELRLFKSYRSEYKHGEQRRDFVYVKDAVNIIIFFLENDHLSGIFNVGTGKSRTFFDLAKAIFKAIDRKPNIKFIEMPKKIRDKYQYFTQADMTSLRHIGYKDKFYELEEGIEDYVKQYLVNLNIPL